MQNLTLFIFIVTLFLFGNKIQAQNTFNKKVNFPSFIGDFNSNCKLHNANDGGYWLIASENSYDNIKAGGQISHFAADGTIIESKQVIPSDTSGMLILDFVEMPNGNRAFVIQENIKTQFQTYITTVLLQIFDPQWNQISSTYLQNQDIPLNSGYCLDADAYNNLYLTYRNTDLKICKFDSKANMIWAKKIEGNNAYNNIISVAKPQSKGIITLDESNFGTIVYNLDENGDDVGSKKIINFLKSDIDFLSNGNLLFTGFASVINPNFGSKTLKNAWLELSPTFNILSTRYFNSATTFSCQTVVTKNDGFVCFSTDDNSGASYFQFDSKRKLINSKYYDDQLTTYFNIFSSNFIVLQNGSLVTTYKLEPKKSELRVRQSDANLELPSCQGKQICNEENSFSVTIEPYIFQTLPLNFLKSNQITTWKNILVTTENECFEITEKNDIVVKDSICISTSIQPFINTKQKGNISWTFENGSPSTSNQLNPGKIKFNTVGTFKIQAILKISECFSDTITKFVTVLPQPIINLPKDTIICNQNVFNVTANVQNAPNWKWEDTKTNENPRNLSQDGNYSINVNLGECKANASISVKFRKADAMFSAPDSICENIKITLIAGQKDDAKHSWQILPLNISPKAEANPSPFLLAKGSYNITHSIDNDGCKAQFVKKIIVIEAPKVDLGADLELELGKTITLSPKITPLNATLVWENGSNVTTRIINAKGTYSITVSSFSCSASDEIKISGKTSIFAPNVFAPDGTNSVFEVFGNAELEPTSLEIYDRWGNFIIKSTDMKWDATFRGQLVQSGVFVYVARFRKKVDNSEIVVNGDVLVLY